MGVAVGVAVIMPAIMAVAVIMALIVAVIPRRVLGGGEVVGVRQGASGRRGRRHE